VEEVQKHAGGDFSQESMAKTAGEIARSTTWITPTLTQTRRLLAVFDDFESELSRPEARYLHPMDLGVWSFIESNLYREIPQEQRVAIRRGFKAFQRPLTQALHQAGAKMMAGTDALIPSVVPGFALHDELEEMVAVGIAPFDALRMSTTSPMEYMDRIGDAGTVEPGKRADLVLLNADPLKSISNTRRIAGVMVSGRWIDETEIQARLEVLATKHERLTQERSRVSSVNTLSDKIGGTPRPIGPLTDLSTTGASWSKPRKLLVSTLLYSLLPTLCPTSRLLPAPAF
jgi:hypothetical protein